VHNPGMKVALIGLAQSGKKTLFTLLTRRNIPPTRTEKEAVEGVAQIRDPRIDSLAALCKPEKVTRAENIFVLCPDMPGDADRAWMEPARRADLLCVVLRDFASDQVYHPAGSVDAERDRRNLHAELILADLELVEKRLERIEKEKRAGQTPAQAQEQKILLKCKATLEGESTLSTLAFEAHERAMIRSLEFLTLKPVIWVYNVDESRLATELKKRAAGNDGSYVVSCLIEGEIMALDDPQARLDFLKELGAESSGVDRLNQAVYDSMGLMSFYTIGSDEVRAWTIRKGTFAPAAAGKIHTDIEKGFIRAEVIKYDDLAALGGEKAAKAAGKMQLKGKDYIVEDGDICHFRFNV